MVKAISNKVEKRRPGRPATVGGGRGGETFLGLRVPSDLPGRLDKWSKAQPDKPVRSEAARRLLESALKQAGF